MANPRKVMATSISFKASGFWYIFWNMAPFLYWFCAKILHLPKTDHSLLKLLKAFIVNGTQFLNSWKNVYPYYRTHGIARQKFFIFKNKNPVHQKWSKRISTDLAVSSLSYCSLNGPFQAPNSLLTSTIDFWKSNENERSVGNLMTQSVLCLKSMIL